MDFPLIGPPKFCKDRNLTVDNLGEGHMVIQSTASRSSSILSAVEIVTCGGTFDRAPESRTKVFHCPSLVRRILKDHRAPSETVVTELIQKGSDEMNNYDRELVLAAVARSDFDKIVIVQGVSGIQATATHLLKAELHRTIVITGAFVPASMVNSDAPGNLMGAMVAARLLPEGVYLSMNGDVTPLHG